VPGQPELPCLEKPKKKKKKKKKRFRAISEVKLKQKDRIKNYQV
jgi:hypothetical protein